MKAKKDKSVVITLKSLRLNTRINNMFCLAYERFINSYHVQPEDVPIDFITSFSEGDLIKFRNFGKQSLRQLKKSLHRNNLKMKTTTQDEFIEHGLGL